MTGQDVMAWVAQGPIMDRTEERLGDTDRGVILYRQILCGAARAREPARPDQRLPRSGRDQCIELPVPWDRGFAWGYEKDGAYVRGSATAADPLPRHLIDEIEDLYVCTGN